jgi:hypothetical protein
MALRAFRQPLLLVILAVLLSACQAQPQPGLPAATQPSATAWPEFDYAGSEAAGRALFRIDPDLTRIDIVVRRDGPLARFGHDHVVTVQDPEGFLLLDPAVSASRADLRFRPDRLAVDTEASRVRHGLDTEPDAADIEGTRTNLLTYVLDAQAWPWASLVMEDFEHSGEHYSAAVTLRINGVDSNTRQPFRLRRHGARVTVDGFLVLRQTDLGIEPFSTLGGGLRVADPMEVHFHLEASSL